MKLDKIVNEIINAAYDEAKYCKHEYFTPEHILYASLFFLEGIDIIEGCGGNVQDIKRDLMQYFNDHIDTIDKGEPVETVSLQNIITSAGEHVLASEKEVIRLGDIFISIYDEEKSFASYYLKKQGIKRIDILNYITHGISEKGAEYNEKNESKYNFESDLQSANIKMEDFTVELTQKARKGEIDPLIGRDEILNRTMQVLTRRTKNNPIHVGEPGVGKTAITEGLAKLIADDRVPSKLKNSRIYSLDMGSILAGTKYRGDFEERIKNILNTIQKQDKSIVYIDEIHTIIGAGSVSGSSLDAANILKPFLTSGKIKFIGATTYDEYKKIFEKDRALSRRFQKIEVPEPSIEETYKILTGIKGQYEKFHNVTYTEDALSVAVELSAKYINDRFLPDKAIDVIDETAAYSRLHSETDDNILISKEDIEKTVSLIAKIPQESVSKDECAILKNLETTLKNKIFSQDKAITSLTRAIKRSRAGFNDENKTIANLLFVGPTGVGKTEITKQLAKAMGIPLIRFDMSEYQEKHTVARLIGSPPGYVGYEEGGLLTDSIKKTPYCVLLLDEIEKAHPDVLNVLLQLMDYATLTDNTGRKTDFKNVILIMTSNAGARSVGKPLVGFGNRVMERDAIDDAVEKAFSPEFRNRLDDIIVFNAIDKNMAYLVAKKVLGEFEDKLKTKRINVEITERCYDFLASKGISMEYGAREIIRIVNQEIKPYFVDRVLFDEDVRNNTIIDAQDGKIKII
ncbi:MAG: ATP-dependent Clp protease ATP-binding subunit ClpA [Clostridium sp.]|jgi:ATP-dependent Clp protease ATP-binding subunit ClpA|uniref:ATP-dependent Clp protease ATP-binding subunit ClpA n=1 Tax=Clostridium sp. TaxID=1506 RepID=UPI0025BBDE67|nr:ATP-dependent Clp protease ATP-binding subunit ClpA [Clostridium sp.]MCH3963251.1 ATP-dependent Clp protease ATP-binding subunit ClpA [Clostridium sp.]MCI1717223.1 ATP-dependent Clp protease ATP-binding subunit ClpA [Clostridium sp.]MCI1801563.1 ATP-dependent Clp protease ATP-binding subunit ClpA [Clostridium sp.]MCI1815409.1 ATP-dependent Clp protease ATP-binding subunit ClpA [Clostridium sp.]MCI1872312.1 ATP-dependent Clp protease ATP-binding subunit ClpA [Clostridium sp.]